MDRNLFRASEASASITKQPNHESLILRNLEETLALGEAITQKAPHLKLLLIQGPLGAGKTTLVKGLAKSLGIFEPITSPTFALAQHYLDGTTPLIHLDLYRLDNSKAANELFLQEEEEANELSALMVVEWPERLKLKFHDAWTIKIDYNPKGGRLVQLISPQSSEIYFSMSSKLG